MTQDPLTLYKLIILYMLNRVNFPLTQAQISGFILDKDYTNYLTLQQVLSELMEAGLVSAHTTRNRTQLNATVAGKKEMEEVIRKAKDTAGMYGKKTILFIDEIHRFNKGQQDYLLPFVEDGTIILIGATTENPYFEVNGALLSRSVIFELKPLGKEDIKELLRRAVYNKPLEYAQMVLRGEMEHYLSLGCDHGRLED